MDRDVKAVRALPDQDLGVELADGRRRVFDLRLFLYRLALQRFKDPIFLASLGIRSGALSWPHEEDITPDTLSAHLQLVAVA